MKFENPEVEAVFKAYDDDVREKLVDLRKLIFEVAATTPGVGTLEETLKWGQPSYLTPETRSGSTIRIDRVKSAPDKYAMYFHCQTSLVETFRQLYPDDLAFAGNRAVMFDVNQGIAEEPLRHCVALALTYHSNKTR